MLILTIVFNLRGPRKPIAKGKNRLSWTTQVPTVDIPINGACCQHIRVVCREIDVRDGPGVPVKRMFNGSLRSIILHIQIPYQCLLVCGADHPIISHCKWRPLYIGYKPRKAMPKMARWIEGGIEVDDVEAIGTVMF